MECRCCVVLLEAVWVSQATQRWSGSDFSSLWSWSGLFYQGQWKGPREGERCLGMVRPRLQEGLGKAALPE